MKPIVTITLNPCIDKVTEVSKIIPDKKLACNALEIFPGGGGINVARAIRRLGGEAKALFFLGGHLGKTLEELLRAEGVSISSIPISDNIRENWIVNETRTRKQFRFVMPGPLIQPLEWSRFMEALHACVEPDSYVVVSGSAPRGLPQDAFMQIGKVVKKMGGKFIADTSGPSLGDIAKMGAFLIKPNLQELAALAVSFNLTESSPEATAKELVAKGMAEIVVLSMGARGALWVDEAICLEIPSPEVDKQGSVGAGDALMAGMVYALATGLDKKEALRWGVACGAATTQKRGTQLFDKADWSKALEKMGT